MLVRLDPRDLAGMPTGDLFAGAFVEVRDGEPDTPVPFLVALHDCPTREVFDTAAALLTDPDPLRRELGTHVLRELGRTNDNGRRPFSDQAIPLIRLRLDHETDPFVLGWLISALGYNGARESLADVLRFADHPHEFVRCYVAAELPYLVDPDHPDPDAVAALQHLSGDTDPEIRYYAHYALVKELPGLDPEQISRAISEWLTDPDDDVRAVAHEQHNRTSPTISTPTREPPRIPDDDPNE